ncbi:hypothetical protein CBL_03145 [Carabus blaptoides fortunei]
MSVTQLDDLMSLMVKSASNSDANDSRVSKTNLSPRELALTSPVPARHTAAVDAPNWRETLNGFVTKYSTLQKTVRGCKVLPSSTNNVRRRRAQPRHARNKANGNQHRKGQTAATSRLGEMELEIRSNGHVGPEYSPVVSLCDILKLNPNDKVKNKDNSPPVLGKDQFLNYFDLASNTESSSTLVDKGEVNKHTTNHPKTLVNCPHVPFSSDLGIKLIKDWHVIPPETHVKKLERLERYIRPNLFNIRHATDCSYEIIYNKSTDHNHIYKFPTKTYHWKGKLSSKARFLLKHYCKPCTVNLTELENMQIRVNSIRPEITSNKLVILNEKNNQKENVQHKVHMEARVVLTDKLKENAQLYKPLSGNTVPHPLPSHTNAVPKSYVSSSHLSIHQQSAGRLQNTVLKTLSPRNENSVGTTMDIKKPVELLTKCKNLINASVILTPINFFELQTSVLETGKTRAECVETSTVEKHDSKKNKINKIGKKRVNIYYPRRISPRLNIVANTSPVKVM